MKCLKCKTDNDKPIRLGDLLGSLNYLGICENCKKQFMSRNEQVYIVKKEEK